MIQLIEDSQFKDGGSILLVDIKTNEKYFLDRSISSRNTRLYDTLYKGTDNKGERVIGEFKVFSRVQYKCETIINGKKQYPEYNRVLLYVIKQN